MSPILSMTGLATGLVASVAASLLTSMLKKEVNESSSKSDLKSTVEYQNFKNSIAKYLKNTDLFDLNVINNIYIGSGIHNLYRKDTNISDLLKIYIVDLYNESSQLKENEIDSLVLIITKIISEIDKTVPFDDLPLTEKTLLIDINSFLENDDKESVKRKVDELAVSIKTREEHLKKLENTNKNSNKVAVIGIILTIVFGFMPFITAFVQKWMV